MGVRGRANQRLHRLATWGVKYKGEATEKAGKRAFIIDCKGSNLAKRAHLVEKKKREGKSGV